MVGDCVHDLDLWMPGNQRGHNRAGPGLGTGGTLNPSQLRGQNATAAVRVALTSPPMLITASWLCPGEPFTAQALGTDFAATIWQASALSRRHGRHTATQWQGRVQTDGWLI